MQALSKKAKLLGVLGCFVIGCFLAALIKVRAVPANAAPVTYMDFALGALATEGPQPLGYQVRSYNLTTNTPGPTLPNVTNFYAGDVYHVNLGDPTKYTPDEVYLAQFLGFYDWNNLGRNTASTSGEWQSVEARFCVDPGQTFFYRTNSNVCDSSLYLTLDNANSPVVMNNNGTLTLSGTVTNATAGLVATVSATLSGITKTWEFETPVNLGQYYLTWTAAELGAGFNQSGFQVEATDGTNAANAEYFGTITVNANAPNYINNYPLGTAIKTIGKGGAEYKFIKMSGDNGADSYWMLADNYCSVNGIPLPCVDSGGNSATQNFWNPTADGDGRFNNWTTMSTTQNSVYNRVLLNFYQDLPNTLGKMEKETAIPIKAYDMWSVTKTGGQSVTTAGACYLTNDASGKANPTACTWSDRISLPSYLDWQGGLFAYGHYSGAGTPAYSFVQTRFGESWDGYFYFSGIPTTRSPEAANTANRWIIEGDGPNLAVEPYTAANGTSVWPVLHLNKDIVACGRGVGTYADPYWIDGCNVAPTITLDNPSENHLLTDDTDNVTLTGTVTDPDSTAGGYQDQNLIVTIGFTGNGKTCTKSTTAGSIVSPVTNAVWSVTFNKADLADCGPVVSGGHVSVTDGVDTATTTFLGTITLNMRPILTLSDSNLDYYLYPGQTINFSGLVKDYDDGQELTITANFEAGGIAFQLKQTQIGETIIARNLSAMIDGQAVTVDEQLADRLFALMPAVSAQVLDETKKATGAADVKAETPNSTNAATPVSSENPTPSVSDNDLGEGVGRKVQAGALGGVSVPNTSTSGTLNGAQDQTPSDDTFLKASKTANEPTTVLSLTKTHTVNHASQPLVQEAYLEAEKLDKQGLNQGIVQYELNQQLSDKLPESFKNLPLINGQAAGATEAATNTATATESTGATATTGATTFDQPIIISSLNAQNLDLSKVSNHANSQATGHVASDANFLGALFNNIRYNGLRLLSTLIPSIPAPTPLNGYVWTMPVTYQELYNTGFNKFTNVEFKVEDTLGIVGTTTYTGTIYLMTANQNDLLYIFNSTDDQTAYADRSVNIAGLVSYPEAVGPNDPLPTISATLGGVTKTASLSALPAQRQGFNLSWQASEVPHDRYGGIDAPIPVTFTDPVNNVTYTSFYTGNIALIPALSDEYLTELTNALDARFAGGLYFPAGTVPGNKDTATGTLTPSTNPKALDFYCYDNTCPALNAANSVQIWYADIANQSNPNDIKTYPFLIQFYDYPMNLEELKIIDSEM